MKFTTSEELKREILSACAASTDADNLYHLVFDSGQLFEQYLQFTPIEYNDLTELINQVDQRFQDLRFDEFKDEDFANWKRVRAAIEHENTLVNHRLSWLFSSQAFLFTAFTVLFNTWKNSNSTTDIATKNQFLFLLILIALIGFFICLFIQRGLNAAEDHLQELDKWWYRKVDNSIPGGYSVWNNRTRRKELMDLKRFKHPPMQGWVVRSWDRWFNYSVTPVLFLLAWSLIFLLVVLDVSSPIGVPLIEKAPTIISYFFFAVFIVVCIRVYDRIRKNP